MNFDYTDKVKELQDRVNRFMEQHIIPNDQAYHEWFAIPENTWKSWPGLEALKEQARAEGLWNLFLPEEYGSLSPGLTNLEYAPLAEIMGRYPWFF